MNDFQKYISKFILGICQYHRELNLTRTKYKVFIRDGGPALIFFNDWVITTNLFQLFYYLQHFFTLDL